MKEICIGIDQSYNNTGISVVIDGEIKIIKSVHLDKIKTKTDKRKKVRSVAKKIIEKTKTKYKGYNIVCIIERIRLHSSNSGKGFLNIDYIKGIGALNATIVDIFNDYGIKVYSVDTRAWKSQVIGTSKPKKNDFGVPEEKWPTIEWVIARGYENSILEDMSNTKKKKGIFEKNGKKYMYNNDAADSAGISMYWFKGKRDILELET